MQSSGFYTYALPMLSWLIILVKRAGLNLRAVRTVLSVTAHLSSSYALKTPASTQACVLNCFYFIC